MYVTDKNFAVSLIEFCVFINCFIICKTFILYDNLRGFLSSLLLIRENTLLLLIFVTNISFRIKQVITLDIIFYLLSRSGFFNSLFSYYDSVVLILYLSFNYSVFLLIITFMNLVFYYFDI